MEIGLCLELRMLNLLGNPLDAPFASSGSSYSGGYNSVAGMPVIEEGDGDGAERDHAFPATWLEAYVGPRLAMCRDPSQRDTAVKLGTRALLEAVRDRLEPGLCGKVWRGCVVGSDRGRAWVRNRLVPKVLRKGTRSRG